MLKVFSFRTYINLNKNSKELPISSIGVIGREQVLRSTGFSSTIQNWLTSTVRRSRFWEKNFFLLNLTPNLT